MTCVVAVVTGRSRILMGADSLVAGGAEAWPAGAPKIWKAGAGKFAIGFCGQVDWGELLRYHVRWPTKTNELPRRLKDCIKSAIARRKFRQTKGEDEALICHKGVIYMVDSHITVMASTRQYAAIGEADLANGVLFATKNWTPKRRVVAALKAAAEHSTGVRKPWVFLQL